MSEQSRDIIDPSVKLSDDDVERSLRPQKLDDFTGQEKIKDNLKIYANCTAESVKIQGNTINSIIAIAKNGVTTHSVKINADKIILAAGPIASSEFLLKNKISPK